MNRKLILTTFGIYFFLAGVVFLFANILYNVPVRAVVYPKVVDVHEPVYFSDSTSGAENVLWEFGNGENAKIQKGTYRYKKAGSYIIRLTIDDQKTDTFYVTVNKPPVVRTKPRVVMLLADEEGIEGEKIHFKALGDGIEWCEWHFGETGKIDAREKESFYAYKDKGKYEISLRTNLNPSNPKKHTIEILPRYRITESLSKPRASEGVGNVNSDFQSRLQAMANGADFSKNYNYLLKKYLCNNPYTQVVINGKAENDFYSYCQGIQLKSKVVIEKTKIEYNLKNKCPHKIIIQQH